MADPRGETPASSSPARTGAPTTPNDLPSPSSGQQGPPALHALRHGHATASLPAGNDLVTMSRRLGNSPSKVTGNICSHVVEELDRDAAQLTAGLLLDRRRA